MKMKNWIGFLVGITMVLVSCSQIREGVGLYSDPTMPLIQLPVEFTTYRQNSNPGTIEAGGHYDMLNVKGPGCVRSFWLLRAEGKRIEIAADGLVQVNLPAPDFFGTLLGLEPHHINSAPIVSMPNAWVRETFGGGEPGYTSYFPIPFQDSCRITIYAETRGGLAAMVNWHKYDDHLKISPYRFHVTHTELNPAPARGSQVSVADISGSGFIAGMFMGTIQLAFDDLMYHMGGYTYLIDGETDPHAIRGHNMEDDYGFTWGFHETMTPWFGVPYHRNIPLGSINSANQSIFSYSNESVVYRFMGPDPISFSSSMSMKVGTRPDHSEWVVYYYKKQGSKALEINTPEKWQFTGTLSCKTKAEFEQDLPKEILADWTDSVEIQGKAYPVHVVESDHSWVNFHPFYFTTLYTPFALTEQAVFAKGIVQIKKSVKATIKLAFDDWMAVWINREKVGNFYHEEKFTTAEIPVSLKKGDNEIVPKSVNLDKIPNMRLWAYSLKVTSGQ